MLQNEIRKQFLSMLYEGEEGIALNILRNPTMELDSEMTKLGALMKKYWEEGISYPPNVRIMLVAPHRSSNGELFPDFKDGEVSWKIIAMQFFVDKPDHTIAILLSEGELSADPEDRKEFFGNLSAKLGGDETPSSTPTEWEDHYSQTSDYLP